MYTYDNIEAFISDAVDGGKFHTAVQAHRDLQSNWEVDLANNLQQYLLKIRSGEITGGEDDAHLSVNFAEAALLLQGSVQVYSKKVEYLHSLVLHALESVSQQSWPHDQPENASGQEDEQSGSVKSPAESDDSFWCSDDIPVDPKNSLDDLKHSNSIRNKFVKPPASLVVLEGDCLDVGGGDLGELESYLLATSDLYRDFLLLDASDSVAVDEFLSCDNDNDTISKNRSGFKEGSNLAGSKSGKSFMSPSKRSGGTSPKLSAGKTQSHDQILSPFVDNHFHNNDNNTHSHDSVADDDPWKPLNPHEPGKLKVKPFEKVKAFRKSWPKPSTKVSIEEEFPLAKLHGPVSTDLHEIWEAHNHINKKDQEPKSSSLYEKLRQSLVLGDYENTGSFNNKDGEDDEYDTGAPDFVADDYDMPNMNEDHFEHESHVNLEDLCRSHLDSLLIAETEKQTALAARVSTWKQRIEQSMDEQDARPPFDIHEYGQRTLDILSHTPDAAGNSLTFTDVVSGQEKHDIARTFSALLQLVNNGNVELLNGGNPGEHVCYTFENPFHVRLLTNKKRAEVHLKSADKRPKPQLQKGKRNQGLAVGSPSSSSSQRSVKLGKVVGIRFTPDGKRRRRSRLVDPDGLNSAG